MCQHLSTRGLGSQISYAKQATFAWYTRFLPYKGPLQGNASIPGLLLTPTILQHFIITCSSLALPFSIHCGRLQVLFKFLLTTEMVLRLYVNAVELMAG